MTFRLRFFSLFICLTLSHLAFAGGTPEASSNIRAPETPPEITNASITSVNPPVVRPGTLLRIAGSGFGSTPAPVSIGNLILSDFVSWTDNEVWLKIPETGVSGTHPVLIGNAVSPREIQSAGSGSITLKFVVDVGTFSKNMRKILTDNEVNISSTGSFSSPLFLKGEFVKSGPDYGQRHPTWDNGSRIPMYQTPNGDVWMAELVLDQTALNTFQGLSMEFGVEDRGDSGTVSDFESNFAATVNRAWAAMDNFPASMEYPTVYPSTEAPSYNAETGVLILSFP
jgi:hypothetical protein